MAYNAGERKDVRRLEKQAKLAETNNREALTAIMTSMPGRAWMLGLLERCHVFNTAFTGDDARTNFNLGTQSVGLQLFTDIVNICPDQYLQMMREKTENDATEQQRATSNGNGRTGEPLGDEAGADPDNFDDYDRDGEGLPGSIDDRSAGQYR